MYVVDSTVDTDGSNCFKNNMAMSEGGGIYAKQSEMILSGEEKFVTNSAGTKGAAVYTSSTTLVVEGSSSFLNNSAEYGGGIYHKRSSLTHSDVEQYILIFTPTSACIKQHVYTSRTIMQLSLVAQYMLQMYLDQASSFLSNM